MNNKIKELKKMEKLRNDSYVLEQVKQVLLEKYSWIEDVTYSEIEDYGPDMKLITKSGKYYEVEVKSTRKGLIKNEDGSFNDYFMIGNKDGMFRNCDFNSAPKEDTSFEDISEMNYSDFSFSINQASEELKDKHCYVLNASSINKFGLTDLMSERCKFYTMMSKKNTILIYVGEDGMLLWNNSSLRESFLGYAFMKCKHTEDFYDKRRRFELKALINMDEAIYVKFNEDRRKFVSGALKNI